MKISKELAKGSTALLVLSVLAEEEMYGYRIIQVIVLLLGTWGVLWLFRYTSALMQRIRAVPRLKKTAAETGYEIRIHPSAYTSLFREASDASVQLENGNRI